MVIYDFFHVLGLHIKTSQSNKFDEKMIVVLMLCTMFVISF